MCQHAAVGKTCAAQQHVLPGVNLHSFPESVPPRRAFGVFLHLRTAIRDAREGEVRVVDRILLHRLVGVSEGQPHRLSP